MSSRQDQLRYRKEFVAESESLLEQADEALAHLISEGPADEPETLNGLFRAIHSLKGVAGMVGLVGVSALAHALESLLDGLRLGKVTPSAATGAAAAAALEELRSLAGRVAGGETDPAPAEPLRQRLVELAEPREGGAAPFPGRASGLPPDVERMLSDYERHRVSENLKRGRRLALVPVDFSLENFDAGLRGAMEAAGKAGELVGTLPGVGGGDLSRMSFRLLVAVLPGLSDRELARKCGSGPPPGGEIPVTQPAPPAAEKAIGPHVAETIRVHLDKVAFLLHLAGELALARWALQRPLEKLLAASTDRQARIAAQRAFAELDRSVTALGRAALAVRLVPVDQMSARLARTVASTAPALEKEAAFELTGGETEVDKVLADELMDPFLHLVRNALDHGIEPPDERLAVGKPRVGRICLAAETRGRDVVFTLSDDGRGIDPAAVLTLAREHGVLEPNDRGPDDPLELLFRPGFSSAKRVSEISGRGFGLDVVRTNLAALKGSVEVRSVPGEGTTFVVTVPATLVLVESLLLRSGGLHFALPTAGILRTLRPTATDVDVVEGQRVLLDDGMALVLAPLAPLLGLAPGEDEEIPGGTVVVTTSGAKRAGLVVGQLDGVQDVIVRPIPVSIPRERAITGAAELPGGAVALVLDIAHLVGEVFSGRGA